MYDQIKTQTALKDHFLRGDSSFLLDFLRVVACQMIVICHTISIYLFYTNRAYEGNQPMWIIDGFLASMGVILFFFVSGIVISNSLFSKMNTGNYDFIGYFIDRFSRIYSGLVPCLAFIFIIDLSMIFLNSQFYQKMSPSFGSPGLSAGTFLASLLMIQTVPPLGIPEPPFAEILWTLNIEWWLYMLFGWAIIYFRKILRLNMKSVLILLALSIFPAYRLLIGPNSLIGIWFFGVLITILLIRGKYSAFIHKHFRILFGLALALIAIRTALIIYWGIQFYEIIIELLIGCMILLLVINFNDSNIVRSETLKTIIKTMARYSFTLYLVNMVIIGLFFACYDIYGLDLPFLLILAISLVSTNLIAFVFAYFTEMRYKDLSAYIKNKVKSAYLPGPLNSRGIIK